VSVQNDYCLNFGSFDVEPSAVAIELSESKSLVPFLGKILTGENFSEVV